MGKILDLENFELRKVIYLLYQKINLSARVPLSLEFGKSNWFHIKATFSCNGHLLSYITLLGHLENTKSLHLKEQSKAENFFLLLKTFYQEYS